MAESAFWLTQLLIGSLQVAPDQKGASTEPQAPRSGTRRTSSVRSVLPCCPDLSQKLPGIYQETQLLPHPVTDVAVPCVGIQRPSAGEEHEAIGQSLSPGSVGLLYDGCMEEHVPPAGKQNRTIQHTADHQILKAGALPRGEVIKSTHACVLQIMWSSLAVLVRYGPTCPRAALLPGVCGYQHPRYRVKAQLLQAVCSRPGPCQACGCLQATTEELALVHSESYISQVMIWMTGSTVRLDPNIREMQLQCMQHAGLLTACW